jgi:hypothetical protein
MLLLASLSISRNTAHCIARLPAHPSPLIARVPPLRRQLRILDYYLTLDEDRNDDDKTWQRISGCGAQHCTGIGFSSRNAQSTAVLQHGMKPWAHSMLWGRVLTRVYSLVGTDGACGPRRPRSR